MKLLLALLFFAFIGFGFYWMFITPVIGGPATIGGTWLGFYLVDMLFGTHNA